MSNPVVSWASDHPVAAGAAAIGIVVVAMMLFGGGGGGGGSNAGSVQAYYTAIGNQAQAGAAVQMAQIQADTTKATTLAATNYALAHDQLAAQVATGQNWYNYDIAQQQIQSNERLTNTALDVAVQQQASNERIAAGQIAAGVQTAGINANAQIKTARASQPSGFAQGVGAVGGLFSNIGNAASKILPFF